MVKTVILVSLLAVLSAAPAFAGGNSTAFVSAKSGDLQTGRSVAKDAIKDKYWLSDDLNRLFLVQQTSPSRAEKPAAR